MSARAVHPLRVNSFMRSAATEPAFPCAVVELVLSGLPGRNVN